MQLLEQQQGNQGCPNLNAQYVFADTDKGLNLQVLFERLEKYLYLPTIFVDGGNGAGAKFEVVGQKNDFPLVSLVPDNHATKEMRASLFCSGADEPDDLVSEWNDALEGPALNDLVRQHCPSCGSRKTPCRRSRQGPASEPIGSPFRLLLCYKFSKFGAGKVIKKLTKQSCYLYHKPALFGICDKIIVGTKNLTPQFTERASRLNPILDMSEILSQIFASKH